jgi:hypothetical protein
VLFSAFFLLQCLSCTYYLFYFSLVLVLWAVALLFRGAGVSKRSECPRLLPPLLFVGAVILMIAIPTIELAGRYRYEER